MGDRTLTDFQQAPTNKTKVFLCPSDPSLTQPQPGYRIYNDVSNGVSPYQAVSYGYNADIACLVDAAGVGRFNSPSANPVTPYGGTKTLNCLVGKAYKSSETLLFADCGIRPEVADANPLDSNDILYYTSSGISPLRIAPPAPGTLLCSEFPQQAPLQPPHSLHPPSR